MTSPKKIDRDELHSIEKYVTEHAPVTLTTLAARDLLGHIAALKEALRVEREMADLLYHAIRSAPCGQRLLEAADTAEGLIAEREDFDL